MYLMRLGKNFKNVADKILSTVYERSNLNLTGWGWQLNEQILATIKVNQLPGLANIRDLFDTLLLQIVEIYVGAGNIG